MEHDWLKIKKMGDPVIVDYRGEVKKQRKEIDTLKQEINNLWRVINSINEKIVVQNIFSKNKEVEE